MDRINNRPCSTGIRQWFLGVPVDIRASWVILLALPWILWLINANWPFQGLNNMDPWYYFGTFIHFPHYQQLRPGYPAERLPWILPGVILNKIFPPAYAELALHFCWFWIALFSLFYLIRRLTNSRTALLASVLMGTHPMFIGANGWTYVDSGCIAWLLLAFACLMRSRSGGRPGIWLFAAGVCWAALIYTYIFWIVLTPCFVTFYLSLIEQSPDSPVAGFLSRRYLAAGGYFLGGALGLTAVLQSVHLLLYGAGHGFFFHENTLMTLAFGRGDNSSLLPGYGWLASDASMVFPTAAFVVCLAGLLLHRSGRRPLDKPVLGILWCYFYSFLILAFFTIYKERILAFSYYADMLVPLLFMTFAVTALLAPKNLPRPLFAGTLVLSSFVASLALWEPGLYRSGLPSHLGIHYLVAVSGALMALFAARRLVWVASVTCLAAASFGLVPQYTMTAWVGNYDGLDVSIRVGDAIKRIEAFLPYNAYPVFWIDNYSSAYTAEYRAIMCGFLSHGISMWHYPKVEIGVDSRTPDYPPGTPIILITENRDVFKQAEEAMADAGMRLKLTGQQLVSRSGVSYWLTFTEVETAAERPGTAPNAVRIPLSDKLQLAYERASLARIGRDWRVITAPQQWAYAVAALLPETGLTGSVRIRARVVRGRVGLGLLNRANLFTTETFADASASEADLSLPVEHSDTELIVLNGGSGGPAEVLLDSIDLSISGRKVADLGPSGAMIAGSAAASVSRGRPTTILTPPEKDSQGAIIPFVANSPSRGLFYVEVKARIQAGVVAVDVVDRNNKGHNAEGLLEQQHGDQDIFVRVPPGLQEGEIEFRNAASGAIRSRAAISDVILWKVN